MSSFSNKTAKGVTGLFIGFIVISFIFTFDSSQSMVGGNTSVAKVGSLKVSAEEFQREYNMQVRMLSFQNGGKSPTSQQLEMFRVKHRALQQAIQKKLLILLAEKSGITPGDESIRKAIKEQEVFQTEGVFDFAKYKNLLSSNRYTPQSYEEIMKQDIQIQASQRLLAAAPVSKEYVKAIVDIKKTKREVHAVQFRDSDFVNHVSVSASEIDAFVNNPENMTKLETIFNVKKSSLDQKAEVKASHILFKDGDTLKKAQDIRSKLSPSNFADMAKKHSQGPSKTKGGDLGWFSAGTMVQEFQEKAFSMKKGEISEPVKTQFGHHIILVTGKKDEKEAKLEDHKRDLARELISETKSSEVSTLRKKVAEEFKQSPTKSNWDKLANKYNLSPVFNMKIDRLSNFVGTINLKAETVKKIFNSSLKSVVNFENNDTSTIINVLAEETSNMTVDKEYAAQQRKIGQVLDQELTQNLWDDISVSCLGQSLNSPQDIFSCNI